jgi:hypothetical protein
LRSFSQVSRQSWYGANTHLHLPTEQGSAERYLRDSRADGLNSSSFPI